MTEHNPPEEDDTSHTRHADGASTGGGRVGRRAFAATLCGLAVSTGVATGSGPGEIRSVEVPELASPGGSFEIAVETAHTAGTTVEVAPEAFDVELSSDEATVVEDDRVRFLDQSGGESRHQLSVNIVDGGAGETVPVTVWVNAADRADADDEVTTTVDIGSAGTVEAIDLRAPLDPDGGAKLVVETSNSAGTTVAVTGETFTPELVSDGAVEIDGGTARFLDFAAGESSHTLDVGIAGGSDGDAGDITAWVNGQTPEGADDSETLPFELGGESSFEVSITDAPSEVEPGETVTIAYLVANNGAPTDTQDIRFEADGHRVTRNRRVTLLGQASRAGTFEHTPTGTSSSTITYTVATDDDSASVDVAVENQIPPIVGDSPPTDIDGDGLFEDVDGDGELTIFDVQALFSNLGSNPVQNNPQAFNFAEGSDPDRVGLPDVQALFESLQDTSD